MQSTQTEAKSLEASINEYIANTTSSIQVIIEFTTNEWSH